jgi:hypothetical protein
MVNHPGTQAENLVPVVTVNTTSIPTTGITAAAAAGTRVRIGARNLLDELRRGPTQTLDISATCTIRRAASSM